MGSAADFTEKFEAGNIDAVVELMASEFSMHHPTHAEPTTNREWLGAALTIARQVLGEEFHFTDHLANGKRHAFPWTATIDGVPSHGVDIITEDDEGRVTELMVFLRPAEAHEALSRAMQKLLGEWEELAEHRSGADDESGQSGSSSTD
jgi:hypothetical protein